MDSLLSKYVQRAPNMNQGIPEKVERNAEVAACKRKVIDLIPSFGVERMLDVGPACGWEVQELSETFGGHITAVTLFREEVDVLIDAGYCDDVHVGDMHDLPESWNERFGLVFASHVLEHSPAPYIFLCEAARVLAPDGVLFLVMPDADGHTGLGSDRAKRIGSMEAHLFCGSIETVIELICHVPLSGSAGGIAEEVCPALEFVRYMEVPQWCDGRMHYRNRIWIARKVRDDTAP